jgi:hypothetical protein
MAASPPFTTAVEPHKWRSRFTTSTWSQRSREAKKKEVRWRRFTRSQAPASSGGAEGGRKWPIWPPTLMRVVVDGTASTREGRRRPVRAESMRGAVAARYGGGGAMARGGEQCSSR